MIPTTFPCTVSTEVGCPGLFDDLEAVLEVAFNAVRAVITDTPCGEQLDAFVTLEPAPLDNGNFVVIYPGSIKPYPGAGGPKAVRQMSASRTQVEATLMAVFTNFPFVRTEGEQVVLPQPAELHEATRFITNIAWCTFCAVQDAINDNAALDGQSVWDRINIKEMFIADMEGGMAGFELHFVWER